MRNAAAWVVFAASLPAVAHGAKVAVTLEGLTPEMETSARARLGLSHYQEREVSESQVERLARAGEGQIRAALEPFGFYSATVTHKLDRGESEFRVLFQVIPGKAVVVTHSEIEVCHDGMQIEAVARALRDFHPRTGEPLRHADYERSKTKVASALAGSGYLHAHTLAHRVEVTSLAYTANIELRWECGTRYRFGPIRFPSTPFTNDVLTRLVPWREGDYYSSDALLELQRRMNKGDYFSTAIAQPRLDEAHNDLVPIDVQLALAKRTVYDTSVYVSTDTGPGVHFDVQRRWINRHGHKMQLDADYAERLKSASVTYRVPFAGNDERALDFGASERDETTDSSRERSSKLAINESRHWRRFTRTLGVQLISGDFEIGEQRGNSTELFAEAVLTRSVSDEPVLPRKGYSLTTVLRVAPTDIVSRTPFASLQARGKWIRAAGPKSRFLFRADIAAMVADDFDQLPPELRFFAGGDRSIRGYDYESIGHVDEAGNVIGGTHLAVLSAEYDRYFGGKWGIAAFIDAGDAFLRDQFAWNVGAGLGIRWKSPVGVVRVDVGAPIASDLASSPRIHFSIGPDL
jgi:translocation and assembly module TamA